MVDVRLLYPAEKSEAAARLADSLEAAGYTAERRALADSRAFPDVVGEGREARVLLLIWSRSLVSAVVAEDALREARRRGNLIEVSLDGIEPAVGAEASPVVLLSGWRGQPFHLGWQRILADIKRLCGPRDGAAAKAGPARAAAGSTRPSQLGRRTLRAALAAGALVVATLGAATLLNRGAPDASPPTQTRATVVAARTAPDPAVAAAQGAAPIASAPPPAATPAVAGLEPKLSADRSPRRPTAAPRNREPRRLVSAARPEVKRYSRKHSKTMRLFCQRSGRSTPQCRTFERSMRALRG